MKVLYIGDVMAEMGIRAVERVLPTLRLEEKIDFVIAQSENVTNGKGMSIADYNRLKAAGVDAFSGGNHTPVLAELFPLLEDVTVPVVGPANMTACPGSGYKIARANDKSVLIVSMLGDIVGRQSDTLMENPLTSIDKILSIVPPNSYDVSIVNLHGDFSSEKLIYGYYLDGRVSLVVGDHWHVQSADASILPRGTAHITDVGMCGSVDSSLGVKFSSIITRWRDGIQTRNELETEGRSQFCAVMADIDEAKGRTRMIRRIRKVWR